MTKIALFIPNLETAGAERVTVLLANGLAQRGYSVDVVLVQAKGDFLADLAGEVHIVDLKASRTLFAIPRLALYLRKRRPGMVISALDHANVAAIVAGWLSRTRIPVAAAIHISRSMDARNTNGLRAAVLRRCIHWCYRRADALVCVSRGVAEDIIRVTGVDRKRVRVIYNPVIHSTLKDLARQPVEHPWFARPACSQAVGRPQPRFRLLLGVGRLTVQKDFRSLLRALKIVRQHHEARLMILGEGNERSRLECLAKELGVDDYVSMPGIVKNPYAYLARADLFVLSSAWEALPTVLIEALAVGTPVVATDCESGPREILRDGRYGTLVGVGDVAALAKAVSVALSAPQTKLPEDALLPYTVDHAVDEYCRFIAELTHE
jgi:glycosyltransferase involved in cell wall biosynthesis